jgi:anthranilate phosphoribosyltransferase
MREILESLCRREHMSLEQTKDIFTRLVAGELSEATIAALLIALKAKGETPEEIAGAAMAMRQAALTLPFGETVPDLGDSCGTGGDGTQTLNISTAAAIVAAEAGVKVAKHGNRAISSQCGSADVLKSCGVNIEATPKDAVKLLADLNICFLFAPQYHAGMRYAMPVRQALKTRTMFNLLGPLVNPARPKWQVLGVYDPTLSLPIARTLQLLGCTAALVVHGGGLDEIALHAPTQAAWLHDNEIETITLDAASLGLSPNRLEQLRGGTPRRERPMVAAVTGRQGHAGPYGSGGSQRWRTCLAGSSSREARYLRGRKPGDTAIWARRAPPGTLGVFC